MTLITIDAVVDVTANALVLLVRIGLRVAVGASKDCVIVRVRVAGRAHAIRTPVVQREISVIEVRRDPRRRVVTGGAGCREARGHVVRISSSIVGGLMAGIAVGRQRGVVVVDVAACARNHHMGTRQGKRRVVVIEACRNPRRCAVAYLALLREPGTDVIRVRRTLEILEMAAHTGRASQVVVVIDMALRAFERRVGASQREAGSRVIELRRHPRGCAVADFTGLRESLPNVIGIISVLVILQVTLHTRLRRQIEISIRVALVALQSCMRAGQGEAHQVVSECGRLPGRGGVARLASLRHSKRHVIRVAGLLIVR